jgi:hypothetical protein
MGDASAYSGTQDLVRSPVTCGKYSRQHVLTLPQCQLVPAELSLCLGWCSRRQRRLGSLFLWGCLIVVAENDGAYPLVLAPDATTRRLLAAAAFRNTSAPHHDPDDLRPQMSLCALPIIFDACLYRSLTDHSSLALFLFP